MTAKIRSENLRQKEAFEYFYAIGHKRTLKKVSDHFEVSQRTVANWSKWFNWKERVKDMDTRVGERMDEKLVESIAETKTTMITSLQDIFKMSITEKLEQGDLPVEIKNIKDIDTVAKLIMLLVGKDGEKQNTDGVPSELKGLSEEDKANLKKLTDIAAMGESEYTGGIEDHGDHPEES